jgi:hypothetical protein
VWILVDSFSGSRLWPNFTRSIDCKNDKTINPLVSTSKIGGGTVIACRKQRRRFLQTIVFVRIANFMQSSRDYKYYKEHAQDVRLEDITSSEQNKNIIRRLRDGDSDLTALYILDDERNGDISNEFIYQEADDLGWLGYFVGESKVYHVIRIHQSV